MYQNQNKLQISQNLPYFLYIYTLFLKKKKKVTNYVIVWSILYFIVNSQS